MNDQYFHYFSSSQEISTNFDKYNCRKSDIFNENIFINKGTKVFPKYFNFIQIMNISVNQIASAIIRNQSLSKLDTNDSQDDMQSVLDFMKLGQKQFRLKQYEMAYDWFLRAKTYCKAQKCLSKINIFLIFCLLAQGKTQEVLKILGKQQLSLIEHQGQSLFQIYTKLNLTNRALRLYSQFYKQPNFTPYKIMNTQCLITYLLCLNQNGERSLANNTYSLACNIFIEGTNQNSSNMYELFQQGCFLLTYGFKINRLEYRRQLLLIINAILKDWQQLSEKTYKYFKDQLESGQQIDILLLYYNPLCS